MDDTEHVAEVIARLRVERGRGTFGGRPANEFRERLTPDGGRLLQSLLKLRIQP